MRDLYEHASRCMKMLDDISIEYGNVISWDVNTRAKSRWGQCRRVGRRVFKINISSELLDEKNPVESLEDTILHELLHTVEGCHGHKGKWKDVAELVNRSYGYNIKRSSTAEEKGVKYTQEPVMSYRYICKCEKCGQTIHRQRKSKFVKRLSMYKCGICGGEFKLIS